MSQVIELANRQREQVTGVRKSATTKRRKDGKTDVVAQWHEYKRVWESDAFLQRMSAPKNQQELMFNGVGYHRVMSQTKRP